MANVCNTGKTDLHIDPITSSDPQFTVVTPSSGYPVTIGPCSCFPFEVRFTPTSPGPKSATLSVPSDDTVTPIGLDSRVQQWLVKAHRRRSSPTPAISAPPVREDSAICR